MSDRELASFFKKPTGSVCGHFHAEQLDRDILIPRKRIPWIKYLFQFTLPAFMIALKTSAQKPALICTPVLEKAIIGDTIFTQRTNPKQPLKGKAKLQRGEVLTAPDKKTDQLPLLKPLQPQLTPVETQNISIFSREIEGFQGRLGGLVATPIRISYGPVELIKKLVDTAFSRFSIYPNPVVKNSSFIINTKMIKKGDYTFSIITLDGEVIQTREVKVEQNEQLISFQLSTVASGNYIARMTSKSSGKPYTEKLIVQ